MTNLTSLNDFELFLMLLTQAIQIYFMLKNSQIVVKNGQLTLGNRENINAVTNAVEQAHSCLHECRQEIKTLHDEVVKLKRSISQQNKL